MFRYKVGFQLTFIVVKDPSLKFTSSLQKFRITFLAKDKQYFGIAANSQPWRRTILADKWK